jgi:hypothetical protein
LASALFGRRPRGLEGVSCSSSSEVARERGFFADRGSGLELGWKTSAARVDGGADLRGRVAERGGVARGLESEMMPGVRCLGAGEAVMEAGGAAACCFCLKAGWRPRGSCCTATADIEKSRWKGNGRRPLGQVGLRESVDGGENRRANEHW